MQIVGTEGRWCGVELNGSFLANRISQWHATTVATATVAQFSVLPRSSRCALTLHNETESAAFRRNEQQTGSRGFFAGRYSVWQRGADENTIGFSCRYVPKGAGFPESPDEVLAHVVQALNN